MSVPYLTILSQLKFCRSNQIYISQDILVAQWLSNPSTIIYFQKVQISFIWLLQYLRLKFAQDLSFNKKQFLV